ncbi:MAG: glycoside hydrolase family 3 C-terminal domain-containing protein [Bacteroidales bacterium]
MNTRTKQGLAALFAGLFLGTIASPVQASDPPSDDIKKIVEQMTLEQKAQLLVGTGMSFAGFGPPAGAGNGPGGPGGAPAGMGNPPDGAPPMGAPGAPPSSGPGGGDGPGAMGGLSSMFGGPRLDDPVYNEMSARVKTYLPGAAGFTAEYPELGITTQILSDGPAGLRISPTRPGDDNTYYATAFPIATVLASSWDTELVEATGRAMGEEILAYGADVILGPGLNLQRDPLCGRNFEYYSEDPLVTGKMAAAMIRGVQSNGVGTAPKHFAVNNQETQRMSVNVHISQRALRELYLRGFEIAVTEGKPWTIMTSYNKVNGPYTSEDETLLQTILRDEWGFDGYVMTDWGGGSDAVAQMKAGNEVIMPGSTSKILEIIEAVKSGKLDESVLDRNVERVLGIMMRTPRHRGIVPSGKPDLKAHAAVVRRAAADGMVLLENRDRALPLVTGTKKIAAFGTTSYDFISGGTGSGDVNEAYTVSLIEGLESAGLAVDATLAGTYRAYMEKARASQGRSSNPIAAMMGGKIPLAEMALDADLARDMAESNDVALVTVGRNAGEGVDRKAEEGDFYLSSTEQNLIRTVTEAFHAKGKQVVVILNVSGVIETASWKSLPDAILLAWQPGQEAGHSVSDVLLGKVNPSGKLAVSFPVRYEDCPTAKNFPGQALKQEGKADDAPDLSGFSFMRRDPWEVTYEEDIYVGYRYYNTFGVPVSYPFGYGLSYTQFEYGKLTLLSKKFSGDLSMELEVKNTGSVAGRDVVQIYMEAPKGTIEKPVQVLVAFGKTELLAPGASAFLHFALEPRDLSFFDEKSSSWVAEAGTYVLKAAASATDVRSSAKFKVGEALTAVTVNDVMGPDREFPRLSKK